MGASQTVAERTAGVEGIILVKDGALLLQTVLIVELEAQATNDFGQCFSACCLL